MKDLDTSTWTPYKQCEVRRPSERGYYFDIVWIKPDLAKRGNTLVSGRGDIWTIHEVFGTRNMPGSKETFKQNPFNARAHE